MANLRYGPSPGGILNYILYTHFSDNFIGFVIYGLLGNNMAHLALETLCSTEAKVTTLECRSKIHMPFERGPYSDIKKQNIFQIYREKF